MDAKKRWSLFVCVALAVVLAAPVAAIAKGGERGPASAPGQQKKADTPTPSANEGGEVEKPKGPDSKADKARDADTGGKGKPEWAGSSGQEADDAADGNGRKAKRGQDTSGSVEASDTAGQRRTGIENAVERIQRNITRAEERVAAGTMRGIPPGLQRVLTKFLGWLGLVPDDPADEAPDDGVPGSTEPTDTPVPDEGSAEETDTPVPDDSDEQTTTVTDPSGT